MNKKVPRPKPEDLLKKFGKCSVVAGTLSPWINRGYYRPPKREFNNAMIVASNWFNRSMLTSFIS